MQKETDTLIPVLKIINAGKKQRLPVRGIASLRSGVASASVVPDVDVKELEEASKKFFLWLKLPHTPSRAILAIMSSGGIFYAAQAMDRTSRAYIECGPGHEYENFIRAVKARVEPSAEGGDGAGPAGAVDDTVGLFDLC